MCVCLCLFAGLTINLLKFSWIWLKLEICTWFISLLINLFAAAAAAAAADDDDDDDDDDDAGDLSHTTVPPGEAQAEFW